MSIFKATTTFITGAMISCAALAHPGHNPEDMGKNAQHFSISTPFTDSNLPHLVVKAIDGNVPSMELIKSDYMDDKPWLVFHQLHHIDAWSDTPIKAADKSYFLMHLLKHKYSHAKTYWQDSRVWNDVTVKLSRNLVNPETVPFAHPELKEKKGNRTIYLEGSPFIESAPFAMTNRHRMRSGLPAIGPDNRPLVLCRFIQDREAIYYEMAQSDAMDVLNETQSGMSFEQSCLNKALTKSYWRKRAQDFETRYGEELSSD